MALVKCYECSKEISDKAPACPQCGAPKEAEPAKEADPASERAEFLDKEIQRQRERERVLERERERKLASEERQARLASLDNAPPPKQSIREIAQEYSGSEPRPTQQGSSAGTCKRCGGEMALMSDNCPHCGGVNWFGAFVMPLIGLLIGGGILLLFFSR